MSNRVEQLYIDGMYEINIDGDEYRSIGSYDEVML